MTPLRPCDSVLEPLMSPRDALPNSTIIYRLILTYKFSLSEAGKVRPRMCIHS